MRGSTAITLLVTSRHKMDKELHPNIVWHGILKGQKQIHLKSFETYLPVPAHDETNYWTEYLLCLDNRNN